MSAGTKIVQLRDALIQLLPYAQTHALRCQRHPCTCNLERAVQVARQLTNVNPARTGGPDRRKTRQRGSGFAMLLLCLLLGASAHAQSTADRAKARGDSLLAVAKCWRFAKAPATAVQTSACPDSVEAMAKMLPAAPVMHLDTRTGAVLFNMVVGQTLPLQATLIRGFLFIWPAGVPFRGASIPSIPVAPPDALRRVI